jgi:hypothetical protein
VVEDKSTYVLLVEGPDYDQHHSLGHIDVAPDSPEDGEDHESVLHAITRSVGIVTRTQILVLPMFAKKRVTRRVNPSLFDEDNYDDPDNFVCKIRKTI